MGIVGWLFIVAGVYVFIRLITGGNQWGDKRNSTTKTANGCVVFTIIIFFVAGVLCLIARLNGGGIICYIVGIPSLLFSVLGIFGEFILPKDFPLPDQDVTKLIGEEVDIPDAEVIEESELTEEHSPIEKIDYKEMVSSMTKWEKTEFGFDLVVVDTIHSKDYTLSASKMASYFLLKSYTKGKEVISGYLRENSCVGISDRASDTFISRVKFEYPINYGVADFINDGNILISIDSRASAIDALHREEEDRVLQVEKDRIRRDLLERERKKQLIKAVRNEMIDNGEIMKEAKRPPIPKDVADVVYSRDKGVCVYCGSAENLHYDHIIPFSKGGATNIENLQLLCQKCNIGKSNKIG